MAANLMDYYQGLLDALFASTGQIKVGANFYAQMRQINKLLGNDQTALISSILEYMIEACFREGTEILTEEGWKDFRDISNKDKFATLDSQTQQVMYKKAIKIINYDYEGDMIEYNGQNLKFSVTPNHRMLIKRNTTVGSHKDKSRKSQLKDYYEFVEADKLTNSYVLKDFGDYQSKSISSIKIDGVFRNKYKVIHYPIIPFLKFLGWYLSEGWISQQGNSYRIGIAQSKKINFTKCIEIEETFKELNLHYNYDKKRQAYNVTNKLLFEWLKTNCYEINTNSPIKKKTVYNCYNKKVPNLVRHLNPELINYLLDTIIKGDGHVGENGYKTLTSSSLKLINDVQELVTKTGKTANIYNKKSKWSIIRNRLCFSRPVYILGICLDYKNAFINKNNLKKVSYKGKVYCVQVEPHNTIYIKYKGTSFWCGNCTVDLTYDTDNANYTKVFKKWKKEVNTDLNLDIPRGLRSLTEQYFRERLSSSFIVLKGKWGKINGMWMPTKMWLVDGASVYVKNDGSGFNTMKYYFGKPQDKDKNILKSDDDEFVLVRKPYNKWTDKTPTPYLVKMGALYHGLFKEIVLKRQADVMGTNFPMGFFIKAGCEKAMEKNQMPQKKDLKELEEKFQKIRDKQKTHPYNKGLVGAFPFDVNFEHLIPDYLKILEEKILKGTDKNILSALGLIEFKGFSSNREEAILNPKVLVERCVDAVLDYVELQDDVVALIKKKNNEEHRKTQNIDVRIHPGIIKSFINDEMRNMIRSWYDRGLVAKQDAVENTTPLNFETQVNRRDLERKEGLNKKCYPPVTVNIEKDVNDPSDPGEDNKDKDKKKGSPESKNYKNAKETVCEFCKEKFDYNDEPEVGIGYIECPSCGKNITQEGKGYSATEEKECILEPMKSIRSIPFEIKEKLNEEQMQIYKTAFNEYFEQATKMKIDNALRSTGALKFAYGEIQEYIEAPYKNVESLPDSVKNNMTKELQEVFRKTFNNALKQYKDETKAFKVAWSVIKKMAIKGKDGKWRKRKDK